MQLLIIHSIFIMEASLKKLGSCWIVYIHIEVIYSK